MLAPSSLTCANPTFFCKAPFSKYPQVSVIPLPWGSLPFFISSCYYLANHMLMGSFSALSLDLEAGPEEEQQAGPQGRAPPPRSHRGLMRHSSCSPPAVWGASQRCEQTR